MASKQDFLVECNEFGLTVQDFEAAQCSRCLQRECERSQHGKSLFEARIASWQDRLFTNVPRMTDGDPRLVVLRSKKFVEVPTGRVPEIRSWVDPRDLDEPAASPQATAPDPLTPVAAPLPPPVEASAEALPEPQPVTPPTPAPRMPLLNTPVTNGRMIGGRKPPTAEDSWAVKPQETAGLKVVKPGARIKLGSGV